MKFGTITLLLCAFAVALSGCLSTSKRAPDELAVIEGPPLWLPPDYELRPPGTETAPVQQRTADGAPPIATGAEQDQPINWLLEEAGAETRDPNIKSKLEAEEKARTEQEKKRSWLDKLTGREPEPVVPDDEAAE